MSQVLTLFIKNFKQIIYGRSPSRFFGESIYREIWLWPYNLQNLVLAFQGFTLKKSFWPTFANSARATPAMSWPSTCTSWGGGSTTPTSSPATSSSTCSSASGKSRQERRQVDSYKRVCIWRGLSARLEGKIPNLAATPLSITTTATPPENVLNGWWQTNQLLSHFLQLYTTCLKRPTLNQSVKLNLWGTAQRRGSIRAFHQAVEGSNSPNH